MTYQEMCRYIVAKEGFQDWEAVRTIKSSKKGLIRARNLCMYFGEIFFPVMTKDSLSDVFGMAHGATTYARKTITNDCLTDPALKRKIDTYYDEILHMKSISQGYDAIAEAYKSGSITDAVNDIISKLRPIAETYCSLTGKKMIEA